MATMQDGPDDHRRQRAGLSLALPLRISAVVSAGLITCVGAYPQANVSPNCPAPPIRLPGSPSFIVAAEERAVTEGEDAVFTITRRGVPGPCQPVRMRISGHQKIMGTLTERLEDIEVPFQPGVTTRTLRLPTVSDRRNEGDGEIRVTIVRSRGYTIGYPGTAAVRVRDDDIPEVTFHAVSPAGLTLEEDTWVGDILEGNRVRFATRCSGGYDYSHHRSFLPLVDHAHDFNHPAIPSYNVSGFVFTPCDREHDFLVREDQSYTGPEGGEIRAVLLSSSDIESRWVDGRVQQDDGGLFHYFACSERDFSFCPRYTVGTPNALRLNVRNANPTVTVAAVRDQVSEGETVRFVITRHWDHPGLFDNAQPGDPAVKTRIGYDVTRDGSSVADEYTGYKERDAFNLTVHEYAVEIPTVDDAMRREDGTVTLELQPDSFADVNVGGTYELYESIPGITPPGQSSIRATVTIRDDDLDPFVSIIDVDAGGEPGSVGFTVSLNGPSGLDVTVDWCISDSAAVPGDGCVAAGTIIIPAGETAATVTAPVGADAIGDPEPTFAVTLSNPVNAVFSGGADTIEAQLLVAAQSMDEPSAPVVAAVPDTAGNLIVSWQPPEDASPSGYEVQFRVRGTESWGEPLSAGSAAHVPILFLEQDTGYEARVRWVHGDGGARAFSPWSEPGYGSTGIHQEGIEPVVTLARAADDPAIEGRHALIHIVVSELRNSYQWHGYSSGIVVGLEYGWRKGGTVLPASSQFGVVPGVFTVDHGLGGYREYRVHLWDDLADHGPLTVTLQPGDGYRVGEFASVCVSIADSETLEATPCPDDEDTTASETQAGAAPLTIAVQDARATEGVDETISFQVNLSAAASEAVTVDWSTADGTATAGQDYVTSSGTLTFAAGETEHTVEVTLLDDAHDEGEETFSVHLSDAAGAGLADAEATGTIANSDPMPRAWLGRFGRTAWEHTLGAVDQRLRSARTPATRAAVAGHELTAAGADRVADEQGIAALAAWIDNGTRDPQARTMSRQELLAGSEFQVATAASEDGGAALTVWGQGAYGHLAGRDGDLAVDGEVATGTLGADYATGPWMAGLALSHSSGRGSYGQPMTGGGTVTSSLTGAWPYVGFEVVPERLSLWLAAGYGLGGLRLEPADGEPLETRINLLAGATGVRGTVVPASAAGGFSLDVNADGMLLRAMSEAAPGMAATTADVDRIRLEVEAAFEADLGGGARLTPSVEVGVRRDGGDAETGFGMDVGGGLSYWHPGLGLSLGLKGRALVLHETADVAEWGASGWLAWDPDPGSELGPALTVSPSIGASTERGAAALRSRGTPAGLHRDPMDANGTGRVDARFGYGLDLMGGVGTPWAGIGLSEREREYRLGYAFHAGDRSATDLRIELVAARRESANAEPEHVLSVQSTVSW